MAKQIYVNLPVADLERSSAFAQALGFELNPQFTGQGAVCVVVSETINFMLLTHEQFNNFSPKPMCDTSKHLEVLLTLSVDSRAEVDDLVRRALAAGGSTHEEAQDLGFMYTHGFIDPDGHAWGLVSMDMSKFPQE